MQKNRQKPTHRHSCHMVRILSMHCASTDIEHQFKCSATAGPSQFSDV